MGAERYMLKASAADAGNAVPIETRAQEIRVAVGVVFAL
jgi:hypothetical protein